MDSKVEQAREWAESVDNIEGLMPGPRAATEVIQSLPDQWIDADKLREVVSKYEGNTYISEIVQDFADLLPTPSLPTLADMNEDDRHALVGKDVKVEGWNSPSMLIAVHKDEGAVLGHGWINPWPFVEVRPLSELTPADATPDQWGENESEDQRIEAWGRLVEHPFFTECFDGEKSLFEEMIDKLDLHMGDRPVTDLPRPEDVPEGEPWIVQHEDREWIGCRNDPGTRLPWLVIGRDYHDFDYCYDVDITLISRLVPEHKENA